MINKYKKKYILSYIFIITKKIKSHFGFLLNIYVYESFLYLVLGIGVEHFFMLFYGDTNGLNEHSLIYF